MKRAVIFDFGNVIASLDYTKAIGTLSRFSTLSPAELDWCLKNSIELFHRFETGSIGSDTFYGEFIDLARVRIGKDELIRVLSDIFLPISSTCNLLARLKPGYKLGLLSNTNPWHFDTVIRSTAVFSLFDAVTLSFQVGAMKPDPRIYRDMLHKLNLPPQACVFIDDLRENVTAAEELGITGILYTTPDALLASLEALSIDIGI